MFKKLFTTMTVVFFALLIVTLQSQEARAGFLPSNLKYHTLKTEHFSIHFPEGLGPVAKEMQIISEEAYQNIVTRLDWQPWGRTHVVLTDKSDKANGMATVLPYNYILLYITSPDADSNLDHYKDYWRMLFNHEFSHIVHIDKHYRWATP
ncbi:MAG TPA: hypothetical protein VJC18_03910, partial [bacterium]|nr:hypothetical protein [bacterium]